MVGGPARAVEHITWDVLHPDGSRVATMEGLANYLESKGFAPTVMIDPFVGISSAIQFYYADEGSSALVNAAGGTETNNEGSVCIQCEWFFTPGTVYEGKTYATLADTPMKGLAEYLEWCESWGVPSVWPMGEPDWKSERDTKVWQTKAGHYGHSQVPENDHTDPGPMLLVPTQQEDSMALIFKDQAAFEAAVKEVVAPLIKADGDTTRKLVLGTENADGHDSDPGHPSLADIKATQKQQSIALDNQSGVLAAIAAKVGVSK